MNTHTDPQKAVRVEAFTKHLTNVFEVCKKHYGSSKYQNDFPTLVFNTDEDDIMGGYYDYDDNEIQINYQGFDDSVECAEYYAKLITHEYIHFTQSPQWFKRYYKMGHDYISHPYEIEAYGRENELIELGLVA